MSSKKDFLFDHHIVNALYPVASVFTGGVTSDWICLRDYRRATFVIMYGVGTTGTETFTLNAATSSAGAGSVAIPFRYRVCASSVTVDTWGTPVNAASAGFTSVAGSNQIMILEVCAEDVSAALAGANFVSLSSVEVSAVAILGGAICILSEPRYPQPVPLTAIA